MALAGFLATHNLPDSYALTAQKWFIPLADELAMHNSGASGPLMVGVNGCQGSGKSTLCDFLAYYLTSHHQQTVAVLSLDDFYLPRDERALLATKVHPLLATRGVPGTHDTELLAQTLSALQQHQPVTLPRFNKATDNPYPTEQWPVINTPVDTVLMEGWCWGAPAQDERKLAKPVNALEDTEDPEGIWRRFVNTQLAGRYQSLFAQMNYWIMLKGPSFDHVYRWRCEQEHKLAARQQPERSQAIMNDVQIARFIQHYQRLTEQCFTHLPARCDRVFTLDTQRSITQVLKGKP
ncbi:kinase [Salinimonas sediminis]|uniref:Kinase n=1 Tax=Salinimonas sediminis TaxID=2303538 RepID=A0A346NLK2_9ALTE|nr:kinase [Salinimonas sediminis]AXR06409.1 kinase [Salinimonas sediminis]